MLIMNITKDDLSENIMILKTAEKMLRPNTSKLIEELDSFFENEKCNNLLIDCSELDYIASAGIGCFLRIRKHLENKNGTVKICSPSNIVKDALLLMGLDRIFKIYSSIEEARDDFKKSNSMQ